MKLCCYLLTPCKPVIELVLGLLLLQMLLNC